MVGTTGASFERRLGATSRIELIYQIAFYCSAIKSIPDSIMNTEKPCHDGGMMHGALRVCSDNARGI